jgi:hypothetical protein
MRCPYPDCEHPSAGVSQLSGDIFCCVGCGRLSYRSPCAECQELNRPFSRFCRGCGENLSFDREEKSALKQWQRGSQFSYKWKFKPAPKSDNGRRYAEPPEVIELAGSRDLPGFRNPTVLVQWSFIDGLIALHQGGGPLALLQPFADRAINSRPATLWSQQEANYLELPNRQYDAELFRPFPPLPSLDHRLLFFSTPYAVFAVDLHSLPGWTVHGGLPRVSCFDLRDYVPAPACTLQAAPIPLAVDPPRVGLLLRSTEDASFYWTVLSLRPNGTPDGPAEPPVPLGLRGDFCQYGLILRAAITFSTEVGHWVWPWNDALASRPKALKATRHTQRGDGRLALDAHVQDRRLFSWRKQFHQIELDKNSPDACRGFHWFYQAGGRMESYHVSLPEIKFQQPHGCSQWPAAMPIGSWLSADNRLQEMLFLGDHTNGELVRRMPGERRLQSLRQTTAGATELDAVALHEPLLVLLTKDPRQKGYHRPELRTLWHPNVVAVADGLRLVADPLVWSRWMFTCERIETNDERDFRCLVRRRQFAIEEASESS